MFTRKHYQAIANAIAENADCGEIGGDSFFVRGYRAGWRAGAESIAHQMADVLSSDNPRFKREKFIDACKLEFAKLVS